MELTWLKPFVCIRLIIDEGLFWTKLKCRWIAHDPDLIGGRVTPCKFKIFGVLHSKTRLTQPSNLAAALCVQHISATITQLSTFNPAKLDSNKLNKHIKHPSSILLNGHLKQVDTSNTHLQWLFKALVQIVQLVIKTVFSTAQLIKHLSFSHACVGIRPSLAGEAVILGVWGSLQHATTI